MEKITSNDFISLISVIDEFISDYDALAERKTSSLKSWIQTQSNKFLLKFHDERKARLMLFQFRLLLFSVSLKKAFLNFL